MSLQHNQVWHISTYTAANWDPDHVDIKHPESKSPASSMKKENENELCATSLRACPLLKAPTSAETDVNTDGQMSWQKTPTPPALYLLPQALTISHFFLPGTVKCVPKVNITGTNETPGPFGPTRHFIIIISDITRWFWDPQLSYIQQMGLRNHDKYTKVETYKWINRTSIMLTRPSGKKRVKPKPPQTLRFPARNYQLLISCRNVSLSKLRTQKVPRPEGTPTSLKNVPWFESPASCKRWRKVAGAN